MQAGNVEIKLTVNPQGAIVGITKTGTVVDAQGSKMEHALKGVEAQSRKTELTLGGLARAAAGLFVFGKVAGLLRDSVSAAGEAAEAQARVSAAIKSTGGVAGVTLTSLEDMAKGLQQVTTFEDDAILSGQSMLLTFTRIGKGVFPQATEAMLNMSTAMGSDLKSAAIQLGKALNDPVEGIGALSRVGVQLSKEQEALIKAFVRVGDVESAQKIILQELEVQMGGLARATAKTGAGPLKQFQNLIGDIKEDLGTALLPVLVETTKKLQGFLNQARESGKLEALFHRVAGAMQFVVEHADKLAIAGAGLLAVFAVERLAAVAVAIKGIGAAIALATAANPVLLAMGVAVTAAGVAFVAARDSAKAFNDKAKNIKEAEVQLSKYSSVAQKVASLHQQMEANNPFGDDKFAPKGAQRRPDAAPIAPKGPAPLTEEQLRAAARKKADAKELATLESDLKYRNQLKLAAGEALQAQLDRQNALADEEYLKGKETFEAQINALNASSLQQQLDANRSHFDALRSQAAEWLLDEQELAAARVQISQAEAEQRKAIYLALAQSQSAAATNSLRDVANAWKSFAPVYKKAAHFQNMVDTYASATASYKALAGIPYVGPVLGAAAAAAAIAGGVARGALIERQHFAQGGIVAGNSTSGDRVPAMVNSREMILTQRQQANLFAMANGQPAAGGGGGIIINGGINLTLPPGATREDARRMGEAAAEGLITRMRRHQNTGKEAVYYGVQA